MIHHQLDNKRHQLTQECRTIPQLVAIDTAVPGGAAMDKLIAQGVHPGQDDGKDSNRPVIGQGFVGCHFGVLKLQLPILFINQAVVVIPEGLVDKLIIQQHAN